MAKIFSTYEAKARFSEVLRLVREGQSVTISYHGEPVAEIRPIRKRTASLEDRIGQLVDRGALVRNEVLELPREVAHRKGALRRFLEDRD